MKKAQVVEKHPIAALLQKVQTLMYVPYVSILNFSCALHPGVLSNL